MNGFQDENRSFRGVVYPDCCVRCSRLQKFGKISDRSEGCQGRRDLDGDAAEEFVGEFLVYQESCW